MAVDLSFFRLSETRHKDNHVGIAVQPMATNGDQERWSSRKRAPICEKWRSINDRLNRYRGLGRRVADRQTLDEIKLIQQLEAQKLAVHSIR